MTTMGRVYRGLNCLFRVHSHHKCGITCSFSTDFSLHLKTTNRHVLLEMPGLDSTTDFLTEIIRQSNTKQVYSQFFSKSTLSQWLRRYVNNKSEHSEQTVSVEEFDPLKHRSIEQTDNVVRATDCVDHASSLGDIFSAMSIRDVLPLPNHTLHTSPTWDFLGENTLSPEGFGEHMETTKKQLGIAACGVPEGSKPVSSRDKFLRQCLGQREAEFTDKKQFTLFIGSWNVFGERPPDSLDPWLLVDEEPPDIYAIGFQEVDWSKHALMNMDSKREVKWLKKVSECVNSKTTYIQVKSIRLVGVLLVVYVQEKYIEHVSYADVDSIATGILGVVIYVDILTEQETLCLVLHLGNKGGVSLRLNFYNTSLCFITSHLAAYQDNVDKRNADYQEIMSKSNFKVFDTPLKIPDHDYVFWFGDLNYRIDLPVETTMSFILKKDYQPLYDADQLYKIMKKNEPTFRGFKEGILNFDPTFRFDLGTDTYNTSNDDELPAYCDRILWRGSGVQQLRFSSHPELKTSDHKPISSLFKIEITVIDEKKCKDVYEEVMKKLDKLEKEHKHHTKVDPQCVATYLKFIEGQSHTVAVGKVGQLVTHLLNCKNTFLYICEFLRELLKRSEKII